MPPGDNPVADALRQAGFELSQQRQQELMDLLSRTAASRGAKGILDGAPFPAERSPDRVVSLESGTGESLAAKVTRDNNLGAEARYGRTTVTTATETVGTSSVEVLAADDARLQFTLQNLSDTDFIHVRLGPNSAAATTNDLRIDPGQMYSLPPGVAYTGAVQAIATAANTKLVVVQYKS